MSGTDKPHCIIDRFEEQWAVIEFEGKINFNIPRNLLPENAREGDVVVLDVKIDKEGTEKRKQEMERITKDMFLEE